MSLQELSKSINNPFLPHCSFVLGAVSPAVVVPAMLVLQKDGYGLEQGIPTLLMAAGSFDDILAITGFTTCLGMAFATGNVSMFVFVCVCREKGGKMTAEYSFLFLKHNINLAPGGVTYILQGRSTLRSTDKQTSVVLRKLSRGCKCAGMHILKT